MSTGEVFSFQEVPLNAFKCDAIANSFPQRWQRTAFFTCLLEP